MNWLAAGFGIGASICLLLAWIGFRYGKTRVSFFYSFLCVSAFYWQMCTTMVLSSNSQEQAVLWSKLAYLGVLFIPSLLFEIMMTVLNVQKIKWLRICMHAATISLFGPFLYSNWLLEGAHKYDWGYWFKASQGHGLFALLFMLVILVMPLKIISLARKKDPSAADRKNLIGIANSILIGNLAGIDFLPDYGINVYPIGFIFVAISFLGLSKVLWQSNLLIKD